MQRRDDGRLAYGIRDFSRINRTYDETKPLPKPKPRWWPNAKCRGELLEVFFPVGIDRDLEWSPDQVEADYAEGKTYCATCPVRQKCLDAAIAEEGPMPFGLRGNKSAPERLLIWREMQQQGRFHRRRPTTKE